MLKSIKQSFLIVFLVFVSTPNVFSQQSKIPSNTQNLYLNKVLNIFNIAGYNEIDKKKFNISYNYEFIKNTKHSNVDNNAEFFSPSQNSQLISARYEFSFSWIKIEFEPYIIKHENFFEETTLEDTWKNVNNHISTNFSNIQQGLKQSRIILHYKGVGISYGMMSHWWSPALHSSIALSSNAPSQETFSFGTYNDINYNKSSFGFNVIVMPYKSNNDSQLYFSGLRAHIKYYSNPQITLGFYRTFLSGNFNNEKSESPSLATWSINDATRLVFEPLFGQNKVGLNYTAPNTPGFDAWDQILSGFIVFDFPKDKLRLFFELASDDNRGNITDLRAHWDHTLGYNIGFHKFIDFNSSRLFFSSEYLNTVITNTNNPSFYRGDPSAANFYIYNSFDYFTYNSRRMGAHSGSSSDDLIFILGLQKLNDILLFTFNMERHGIKYMKYPELKNELSIILNRKFRDKHSLTLTLEYEKIYNFAYKSNISISKLFWLSYSFSI